MRTAERRLTPAFNPAGFPRDVIVLGASAGGVEALRELFSMFPADLPAIVGCVLHRGPMQGQLAAVLGRRSKLPVIEPHSGETPQHGTIYLAPPDHHLLFQPDRLEVNRGPKLHSTRPAIDRLFHSAAETYGRRVVGAILTGAGQDGVSGMIAIGQAQGLTVVQDPAEAYMPVLPLNAIRFDHAAGVFPLKDLGPLLVSLARGAGR
jgi:two-component system chemotaxis response regulator CheB